jgi:hypothetical protein
LTGTLGCAFFLNETLKTSDKAPGQATAKSEATTWEVLKAPGVPMVLFIQAHVNVLSMGYTAVSSVYQFTDVQLGGLSFTDRLIAIALAVAGISQAAWILIVFPPAQKRYVDCSPSFD